MAQPNEPRMSNKPSLEEIQAQIAQMDLEDKLAARRLKEEERQRDLQVRLEGAKVIKRKMAEEAALQKHCTHQMDNGRTSWGGVRDWQGLYHMSCGRCWMRLDGTQSEVRKTLGNLFPGEERIGGPIIGGGS